MYEISIKDVSKKYKNFYALNNVNLDVKKGEIVSIIGPSGSGKSTLLRCIIKLEKINSGSIELQGSCIAKSDSNGKHINLSKREIDSKLRKTGMVFQNFNLFPHMKVLKNITEALIHVNKMSKKEAITEANKMLKLVGLLDKADNYPYQLSGGQKQRAAIARAIALKPQIMLFDEPTSALDPELVGEVLQVIKKLVQKFNMTMVIVTHEIAFAKNISDKIVFMEKGSILENSSPQKLFNNPEHPRVKEFIHKMI